MLTTFVLALLTALIVTGIGVHLTVNPRSQKPFTARYNRLPELEGVLWITEVIEAPTTFLTPLNDMLLLPYDTERFATMTEEKTQRTLKYCDDFGKEYNETEQTLRWRGLDYDHTIKNLTDSGTTFVTGTCELIPTDRTQKALSYTCPRCSELHTITEAYLENDTLSLIMFNDIDGFEHSLRTNGYEYTVSIVEAPPIDWEWDD